MYYREYEIGFKIFLTVSFFISWIYCTATYGFLLGFGLGWIPSLILGYIVGLAWPAVLLLAIGAVWYLFL